MKNRKTAVLLGAAALTAALGLGYGLLTGAEQAEESSSAAGVAAFSPTGAVSVICYENEGGEIALEYLDDTWTLRRDADFPVNQTSAESMANYLAPLNATALVTQSGADLVAYGLDEPSNRIEVATDAGETCTVLVGAQNTHTGEYYIKLEGEEPVYTVSESFAAAFTRTERGLQQTENWPVESTDSVTRATLEQGSNTLTVDVSEDADGNKTYTASDTARTETPDTAAAQAFISSAATLYFSSSADFKPTDEALAAYERLRRRLEERANRLELAGPGGENHLIPFGRTQYEVWLDGAWEAKKAYQAGGISTGEFLRRIDVDGELDGYQAARDTFPAPSQTPWRDYIKRDMDFVPGKRFTDMLYLDLSADAPAWTMITAEEQTRKARGGHASLHDRYGVKDPVDPKAHAKELEAMFSPCEPDPQVELMKRLIAEAARISMQTVWPKENSSTNS